MAETEFTKEEILQQLNELDHEESVNLREKFQRHFDGFWEFQKYMDSSTKSGYRDEQIDVKLVAYGMYLVIWGYVTKLVLSMPRRRRKSHAVNDAVKYVVGFMPDRSNGRFSHSENLVKKHSRMIKKEILSEKFLAVFPNTALKTDARNVLEWETIQCNGEPTFHCAGVGGTATGYGVDKLMIADDTVSGWKSANSPADQSTVASFISGNFESSEEEGMCILHIATRWIEKDPPGKFLHDAEIAGNRIFKFDAYKTKLTDENIEEFINHILDSNPGKNDILHITIPALDKDDETTAPYSSQYTTKYYKDLRKKLYSRNESHIWYSIYQQDPRQKGSLLFVDFDNYYDIQDVKKNLKFSGGVSHLDPAGKGRNNTCLGLARTINEDVYIMPEIIYTPEKPSNSKPLVIAWIKKFVNYLDVITGEGNGGGDQYCESINETLNDDGIKVEIDIINSDQNKELKIFLDSDWVLTHVWLPAEFGNDGKRQYEIDSPIDRARKALTKYVGRVEGQFIRNQEDDFLDFLSGVKDIVAEGDTSFNIEWA